MWLRFSECDFFFLVAVDNSTVCGSNQMVNLTSVNTDIVIVHRRKRSCAKLHIVLV